MSTARERPILFSGEMVRAILAGTKTQTRRPVKVRGGLDFIGGRGEENDPACWGYFFDGPHHHGYMVLERGLNERHDHGRISIPSPFGEPGDRLWARETWAAHWMYDSVPASQARSGHPDDNYWFRADPDGTPGTHGCPAQGRRGVWRPSIHMPRWASRLTLEITGVRVERLQDITEEDALAEGAAIDIGHAYRVNGFEHAHRTARGCFETLWGRIYGAGSFAANPWVWVVSFKVVPHV